MTGYKARIYYPHQFVPLAIRQSLDIDIDSGSEFLSHDSRDLDIPSSLSNGARFS